MELRGLSQQIKRIDFLHGLGVSVETESVALACVSKRFLAVSLSQFRRLPLPPISALEERTAALAQAVGGFVDDFGIEPGAVHLCLSRQEVMVNRILLPAAAKENLAQVLEYEVERVIPVAREEIFFDYQVGEGGSGDGGRISVLVVCVTRSRVSAYIDSLATVGALPKAVVASPTALGDCVSFLRGEIDSPIAVVSAGENGVEIALLAQNRLIASHMLTTDECRSEKDLARIVGRDLDAEIGRPQGQPEVLYTSRSFGDADHPAEADLTEALLGKMDGARECGLQEDGSFIRAVGAALGAAREGQLRLNLLPKGHRQSFREGLLTSIVLLAFSVLLLIAWGTSAVVRDGMTARQLRGRIAELEPEVKRVEKQETEGKKLVEALKTLTAGQDKHVIDLLKEMTELVPTDAYLTTFRYRNGRVEVDGFASSAADLIAVLENSPMFSNVSFTSPVTKAQNARERFSLVAEVER